MRFTYAESMCDPSHYLPLAVAADQSGWDSFTVNDSVKESHPGSWSRLMTC